ncbi:PepSY-associated TM helix domain-containing protein [Cupriavidus metallidurans]|jgi:uncharacterized protein|uniref:PepSY-associated TM helix domain-containing protein n=1 Tax=Cupriavidus metallidurans TaxID=119219 RepID=UPI001648CF7E|nr:PepSY-associated TM helix domain-containing protein [Cupriavidus metallidurans]
MTDLTIRPRASLPSSVRSTRAGRSAKRRAALVRWLRKAHGWFGLWGAVMGLIFGFSGIWMNHRAALRLPVSQQKATSRIALTDPLPTSPEAMGAWLQQELRAPKPAYRVRREKAQPAPWAEQADNVQANQDTAFKSLMQPERWLFNFGGPSTQIQVEYWLGNHSVSVRQTDSGFIGTLMSLHIGNSATVPWVLLVDTLAGCVIFLSISGLWLWGLTTKRRTVGWTIFGIGSVLAVGLAVAQL